MKRQIKWNQYEAAILLDAYLKILTSGSPFSKIVEDTSKKLRVMAVNNGLAIDDTYRNINGIILQMYSMESAYLGYKKRIPATKLFTDVVRVYQEDRKVYNEWLTKANVMADPNQKDKETFYRWLRDDQHMAEKTCRSYVSSIRSAEKFAEEHRLLSTRLFTDDIAEVKATADALFANAEFVQHNSDQYNHFSAAINKLLKHMSAKMSEKAVASVDDKSNKQTIASAEINSEITAVLNRYYEYGFKYDSIRELMRFRQFADAMGIVLPEEDEVLKVSIISSGTIIDGKIYCTSDDMPQELKHILDDIFSSGAGVIYYESLFEKEYEWMESHFITSPYMLKEYLQKKYRRVFILQEVYYQRKHMY